MDTNGTISSRRAPARSAERTAEETTTNQDQLGTGEGIMDSRGILSRNPESFGVVLNSIHVTAKDVAVERPINISATPPINFGIVVPGLYRSGYPQAADFPFMRSLKLKTIVTLVGKDMPEGYQQFIDSNGINHRVFDMMGTKKEEIPVSLMVSILTVVMNCENYPLLIHCNHGKHRTGCVVGIIRMKSAWDVNAIIQEYTNYAAPKTRMSDIAYIRNFRVSDMAGVKGLLSPKPKSAPVAIGTFFSFVVFTFFALCIWIFTSSKLLTTTTPRRDRMLR